MAPTAQRRGSPSARRMADPRRKAENKDGQASRRWHYARQGVITAAESLTRRTARKRLRPDGSWGYRRRLGKKKDPQPCQRRRWEEGVQELLELFVDCSSD